MRIYQDKKRKETNRASWCIEINIKGKRRRKYFTKYREAKKFDENEWILSFKHDADGVKTSVKTAIKLYLENYQLRYPGQRWQHLETRLSFLLKWGVGDLMVDDIDENFLSRKVVEQETWKTASSKFTYKNQFVIFLNWCGVMGYSSKKKWEVKTLRMKKVDREIGVLSVEQAESLLKGMNPTHVPAMAIMLFAGVRPMGEMEKLNYSHIKHGVSIDIPASKTPKRLITELPDNLWTWIPKRKTGKVMSSWNAMRLNRRRTANELGFKYPADGARHSFGSYAYWVYGLEWTMHTMGHMNYDTFKTYYKNERISPVNAKKYFTITCV